MGWEVPNTQGPRPKAQSPKHQAHAEHVRYWFQSTTREELTKSLDFVKDLRLNQQPVYRTLNKLKTLGFITMKSETTKKGNFPSKNYYLTSKGKKLGTHFLVIYDSYRELTK